MIHRLSEEVRAALRTGVALTSFAQAVEELVLNSIDAGATSVAVRVDLQSFKIQIVDNGAGITQEQFPLIGERYATSKCNSLKDLDNLKYFGYRGEALASLRSVSTFLEIISRPRSSGITYCKCFHNGKPSDIMESSVPRPSAGTTVTAYNLFYNLPVRQKHLNEGLEMERIRFHVAATALMWPHISFSLRDDSVGHVILQTCKSNSVPMSLSTIFPAAKSRNLKELSISAGELKIYGVVCTDSYSRKDLQFVFVNKRLVLKSSIHHQMNKILGRSLILRKKCISWDEKLSSGFVNSSSPVKQAERYGIFVINVECPYSAYDITFEPRKTLVEFKNWPKLIHLIQDLIYGFLRKENLLSLTDPPPTKNGRGNEKDEERYQSDVDNEREESEDEEFSKNIHFNQNDKTSINCTDTSPVSGATFLLTDATNALFSKTVCRPKVTKDCLDPYSSMPAVANQNVAANVDISLGAFQKLKGNYLFTHSHEELLPGQSHTKSNNLHNGEIDSEKPNGRSKCDAHKTAPSICLNDLQGVSRNVTTLQSRSKSHQGANEIGDRTDHSEIPFPLSGLNQVNEPEDIFVRKQKGDQVRAITLGKSVHYHSTLKRLRDGGETALGSAEAGEIITNSLQQLRQSAQEAVKSLGDLYKTPVAQRVDLEDELHRKQPRMEVKINQANTLTNTNTNISRCEAAYTKTRHHDESVSGRSSQEGHRLRGSNQFGPLGHSDGGMGHSDRGVGHSDREVGHTDRGVVHSDREMSHSDRMTMGRSDRGMGHSDRVKGHSDRMSMGHSDRGVGHSDREMGHTDRGVGHSDREMGHTDRGVGHSDREMGHTDRGVGHSDRMMMGRSARVKGHSGRAMVHSDKMRMDHSDRRTGHREKEIVHSDRGIIHSDGGKCPGNQGIGRKRSVKQSVSQAAKLSKLMKGEKVTGDVHLDEPDTRSSKRSALLKTFTYSKQMQDDDFNQARPETHSDSSYVIDTDLVYVKNMHCLSELSVNSNERHSPISTASSKERHSPISTASNNERHPPISTASSKERHPPISTASSNERHPPISTASSNERHPPISTASSNERHPPISTASSNERHPPISTASSNERHPPISTASSSERHPPISTASSNERHPPISTASSKERHPPISTASSNERHPPISTANSNERYSPISTASSNERYSPISTAGRSSHGKNTSDDWTSLKQIPNGILNEGRPSCRENCCCTTGTKEHEKKKCLPFSMYPNCKHKTRVDEVGTPRVSVVLSLPIEDVRPESIMPTSLVSKCPTTTPFPFSLYTPQGVSISMPQISFRNTPESLSKGCDIKSVSKPCQDVNEVVQLSQGCAVKNVCSTSTQTDTVSDSQGFHMRNHVLVDDSIDSLKGKVPDLVAADILNTPTMYNSYHGEGLENVRSHSGFTSGGFSVKLSSSSQEKSESTPVNTSDDIGGAVNLTEKMNELPFLVMCQNANGLPIEISCVDDTHQTVDSTSIPVTLVCSASQTLTCTVGQSLNCPFSQPADSTPDQSNAQHLNEQSNAQHSIDQSNAQHSIDQCPDLEYIVGDQLGTDIIPQDPNSETSHTPLQTPTVTSSLPELEKFSFSRNEITSNQYTQSCLVSKNENAVMEMPKKIQKSPQLVGNVQRIRPEVRNEVLSTENYSHNLVDPKLSEYNFVTYEPRISPISRLLNSGNSSYECSTTAEPTSTYFLDKFKSFHGDAVSNDSHRAASISPLHAATQSLNTQSIAVVKGSHCQNTGTVTHLPKECDEVADQDDDSEHSDSQRSSEEINNPCCTAISNTMASNTCSNDSVPCAQQHPSSAISLSESSGGSISIFDYITEGRDCPLNTGQVQAANVEVNAPPNVDQLVNNGSESLFGNTENLKTQTHILSSNNVVSISDNEPASEATISISNIPNDTELTHSSQMQSRERNPLPGTALPDGNIAGSRVNEWSPPPLMQKNSDGFLQTNVMYLEVTGSYHESDDHIEYISHCKERVSPQPERLDPPAVSHAQAISHVSVTEADNHRDQLQTDLEQQGGSENRHTPRARISIVSVSSALDLGDHKPQPLKVLREHCRASFTKREHSDAQITTEVVPLGPELVQNLNTHRNSPVQSLTSSASQTIHGTWSSDQASCDSELMKNNGMHWQEISDSITGRRLYINNESGHTLSEDQWTEISAKEPVLDKSDAAVPSTVPTLPGAAVPGTMPESLSAQLTDSQRLSLHDMVNSYKEQENCDTLSKWRGGERPVYENEVGADISTLMSKWTNPVFLNYKQPSVNAEICPTGQTARSCFNSLSPVEFTKHMLTNVKVIGQIDCKFIACLIQKSHTRSKATNCHQSLLLVLFDQHAVHERIRLEQFTRETYEVVDGVRSDTIKRSDLSPPHPLTMDLDDLRLMKAFSKEFNRIGVTFVGDRTCRNVVHISSAPVCLIDKDAADTKRKAQSLPEKIELLIKEHIQLIKSTNGACGRMPLTIHKRLCSQACHGAVKFGDKLTLRECEDLLSALKSCDLPFQCAHGRPSVTPLVDVTALEKELSEQRGFPRLSKISANICH